MSTTTSVQETLPLEGADPCQFVVISEDSITHESAMEVCGGVLSQFDAELAFAFSFWKLKDLGDPAAAHGATKAVARADIVLFSLRGRELTPEMMNWLESCMSVRTKTQGALALLVADLSDLNPGLEALLYRMFYAARRLRMDFLPLLPLTGNTQTGPAAEIPPALLSPPPEEHANNHWGLNE